MNLNNLGIIGIVEINKLIITNFELKELITVNKYFNEIIHSQFPRLRKTLIVLDEFSKILDVGSKNHWNYYSNIKYKQINRKLH